MVSKKRRHRRARHADDKQVRRETILDAARGLFEERPFDEITMQEVAKACGLAKGTLYLYFATKEELFLGVSMIALGDWLDELDGASLPDSVGLVRAITSTLRERRPLLRILAILHSVLERNVGVDALRTFKIGLLARLRRSGGKIEAALGLSAVGDGARLLLRTYAIILGLYQIAAPGPRVAEALSGAELTPLRLDYFEELEQVLLALFAGLQVRFRDRKEGADHA